MRVDLDAGRGRSKVEACRQETMVSSGSLEAGVYGEGDERGGPTPFYKCGK